MTGGVVWGGVCKVIIVSNLAAVKVVFICVEERLGFAIIHFLWDTL